MAAMQQREITRTERRRLLKEKREAERRRAKRNKKLRRWGAGALLIAVILGVSYLLFFHRPGLAGKGVLRVANSEYNFGVISVAEGEKSARIPLINIGDGALTITRLDSSCGCTSASVENNGSEGPRFHMAGHAPNPTHWRTVIKPGGQAFLKVYFDPRVHPNVRGSVTRIITIHSDDPRDPEQEVRIKVYQVG